MALIEFENEDKYFIKFFLLDASLNLNRWGVTQKALRDNLNSFIGKPFVLTPNFDHPSAVSGDDLMVQQEAYRVGDIVQVGIEQRSGKAWGLAEITNSEAAEILKRGDVQFVSPSIVFDNSNEDYQDGSSVITSFTGAHVAAVKDPAYGITKAEIKGRCSGSSETCLSQLKKVQASRSSCGKFTRIKVGNKEFVIAANDCVERCIKKKVEAGVNLDDQALAICYSECGESNKIKEETSEPGPSESESGLTDDKDTSDKLNSAKKYNNMKRKYANDESDKEKVEESEDENKLDLTDRQEEYLKDKESKKSKKSKKAEDEEEKYEREMSKAEDEEKEDAEDEEDDKKDASLRAQVKSLKTELSALRSKIRAAEVEPLIDSILEAKQSFNNNIDTRAEYAKLSKMDKSTLEELAGNYKEIVEAKVSPRYQVKYASVEKSADVDSIIKRLRGGIN